MSKTIKKGQLTLNLPCSLTKTERLEYADKLGESYDAVEEAQSKKKSAMAQLKSAQAEHDRLSAIVSSGTEYRDVTIDELLNFDSLKYSQVRTDTGEVIYDRPMSDTERQTHLLDDVEELGGSDENN